jgi:hypothetical protein
LPCSPLAAENHPEQEAGEAQSLQKNDGWQPQAQCLYKLGDGLLFGRKALSFTLTFSILLR